MKRYDSYKDSGVKWLGEIPSHWKMERWRFLMNENVSKNNNCNVRLQLQFKYGDIVRKLNQSEEKDVLETISKYTVVEPDDIMINGLNLNYDFISQRVARVREEGAITSAYVSLRPTEIADSRFYTYFLKSMDAKKMFHGMGTGIRLTLSYNELKNQFLPKPSIKEQEAIANYLDSATSKIDEAIAQQQKMIDLLNERKQIIINNAVTKGLDPNVKMKPSGIDWIGDIPEHWEIRRMRYLCKITTGNKDTINRVDDGLYPFYVRSPKVERINSYSYDGEAVLMAGDGVGAGKVFHYVNGKFDYHQRVYCFYEIEMIKAKLLYYYMQNLFKYVIEQLSAKSTVDSVRLNMIQDFVVCIPSIKEQIEIVNFIDKEFANIEKAIQISLNQISLLQERKQIIINDVVTGKVKVV